MRRVYLFSISSHPDAISINSLDITFFKPSIDFSHYDALIITSKQASKALLQYEKKEYLSLPALCVSKQSAKAYEMIGGTVLQVGGGYGDNLEALIQKYPKTMRWLYLRAEVIASEFAQRLNTQGYRIDEAVVYKSACSRAILEVEVPSDAVLIFTSPSSVACYLKNNTIEPSHKVIVIGKTTAKALPQDVPYHIAKETTIASCFEMLDYQ